MKASNHRYPGRLRLRFTQLKREPLFAAQVAAAIRGLEGVVSVDANAVTGGLLIVYDIERADSGALWPALRATLAAHGLHEHEQRGAQAAPNVPTAGNGGVADMVVGAVVERLVERSALALVAALL